MKLSPAVPWVSFSPDSLAMDFVSLDDHIGGGRRWLPGSAGMVGSFVGNYGRVGDIPF